MTGMDERLDELAEGPSSSSPAATIQASREDSRPKMPEPPPVALVAVQDVRLPVVAGLEHELDWFYRDLLRFERQEASADSPDGPVYRSENHDLCFFVVEVPPERPGCRPVGIISPFFSEIVEQLDKARHEFEHQRGLVTGEDGILLQDPSGNWITLAPLRRFF